MRDQEIGPRNDRPWSQTFRKFPDRPGEFLGFFLFACILFSDIICRISYIMRHIEYEKKLKKAL